MAFDLNRTVSQLQSTLDELDAHRLAPDVVCARFRVASLDWPGLPLRYGQVLERLLQPLDTAMMLGDESCSFSRAEVVQALRDWLDHAARLPKD
jgi:hypothetical protein